MHEPIYGQWFLTEDVPVPEDMSAWIVVAQRQRITQRTTATLFWPGEKLPPVSYAWVRIPPPPWLEGK